MEGNHAITQVGVKQQGWEGKDGDPAAGGLTKSGGVMQDFGLVPKAMGSHWGVLKSKEWSELHVLKRSFLLLRGKCTVGAEWM